MIDYLEGDRIEYLYQNIHRNPFDLIKDEIISPFQDLLAEILEPSFLKLNYNACEGFKRSDHILRSTKYILENKDLNQLIKERCMILLSKQKMKDWVNEILMQKGKFQSPFKFVNPVVALRHYMREIIQSALLKLLYSIEKNFAFSCFHNDGNDIQLIYQVWKIIYASKGLELMEIQNMKDSDILGHLKIEFSFISEFPFSMGEMGNIDKQIREYLS